MGSYKPNLLHRSSGDGESARKMRRPPSTTPVSSTELFQAAVEQHERRQHEESSSVHRRVVDPKKKRRQSSVNEELSRTRSRRPRTQSFKHGESVLSETSLSVSAYEVASMLKNTDGYSVRSHSTAGKGIETSFLKIDGQSCCPTDDQSYQSPIDEELSEIEEEWSGTWLCRPYKRERLFEDIYAANRTGIAGHAAVLNSLKDTGTVIFIIDSKVSTTSADVLDSILNVIYHVTKEERSPFVWNPHIDQRCLLYRDHEGRFFNLVLAEHTASLAGPWEGNIKSFSGLQALAVLVVLCRSLDCIFHANEISGGYRIAYLAALLGLVFVEEISFSWVNVTMMVRGIPSMSAYSVVSGVESDWSRKSLIAILLLASATTGTLQYVLTVVGIFLTFVVVLANVGSRVFGYMHWVPVGDWWIFEPIVAYLVAVLVGMFAPYLCHRGVEPGGKTSLESVIQMGLVVWVVFLVSGTEKLKTYLIIGDENCSQNFVNVAVGIWWSVSMIFSLFLVLRKEHEGLWPEDEEPLLEKDHCSPVGFKIPNLPEFVFDPCYGARSLTSVNRKVEFGIGVVLAVGLGVVMWYIPATN